MKNYEINDIKVKMIQTNRDIKMEIIEKEYESKNRDIDLLKQIGTLEAKVNGLTVFLIVSVVLLLLK